MKKTIRELTKAVVFLSAILASAKYIDDMDPVRNKCVRFYNHQRAHVFSNECVPYTEEQYDFETEECEMYKPIEK